MSFDEDPREILERAYEYFCNTCGNIFLFDEEFTGCEWCGAEESIVFAHIGEFDKEMLRANWRDRQTMKSTLKLKLLLFLKFFQSLFKMKVRYGFLLSDFWVGFTWDGKRKVLYFCPLPCCMFSFHFEETK